MTDHPDLRHACNEAIETAELELEKRGHDPHQILVLVSVHNLPSGGNACTGGLGFEDPADLLASLLAYCKGMADSLGLPFEIGTVDRWPPGRG